MSLKNWLDNRWLRAEATSSSEIGALLNKAQHNLRESKRDDISLDWRLRMAYEANLDLATMALRAEGFRVPSADGHHYRTIESLRLTINLHSNQVRILQSIREKRNLVSYDAFGIVTEADVHAAIQIAGELETLVLEWLRTTHPDLML